MAQDCGEVWGLCEDYQVCINIEGSTYTCVDLCGYREGEHVGPEGGTYCLDTTQKCIDGNCTHECNDNLDLFCDSDHTCINYGCVLNCESGGDYCPPNIETDIYMDLCVNNECLTKCEYGTSPCTGSNENNCACPEGKKCIVTVFDSDDEGRVCLPPCDITHGYCEDTNTICIRTNDNFTCTPFCTDNSNCPSNNICFHSEDTSYCVLPCENENGYYCPEGEICIDADCVDICGETKGYCPGEDRCLPINIFEDEEECVNDPQCEWTCYPPCDTKFGYCDTDELCQRITETHYNCVDICGDSNGPCADPNQLCVSTGDGFECLDICGTNNKDGPCTGDKLCVETNGNFACANICGPTSGPCPGEDDICVLQDCGISGECAVPYKCVTKCSGTTQGPCHDPNQICVGRSDNTYWTCVDICGYRESNKDSPCQDPAHECTYSDVSNTWNCSPPCGSRVGKCDNKYDICIPDINLGGYECVEECGRFDGPCLDPNQICQHDGPIYVCVDAPKEKNIFLVIFIIGLIIFIFVIAALSYILFGSKYSTYNVNVIPDPV